MIIQKSFEYAKLKINKYIINVENHFVKKIKSNINLK